MIKDIPTICEYLDYTTFCAIFRGIFEEDIKDLPLTKADFLIEEMDMLDVVEMVMEIEKRYGINISDEIFDGQKNEPIKLLHKLLKRKNILDDIIH